MNVLVIGVILWSSLIIISILHAVYNRNVYKKIKERGVAGFGRIISCERKHFNFIYSAIFAEYEPIVEFFFEEKRYKAQGIGRFDIPPGKIGDEVEIVFFEEYPGTVIISRDEHILDFVTGSLRYFTVGVAIFMIATMFILAISRI